MKASHCLILTLHALTTILSGSLFTLSISAAEWDEIAAQYAREGDTFLEQGRPFEAVESYRRAIEEGVEHPEVYRNLSVTLFNLGLIDDALPEMQKAVQLAADRDLFQMELGVLYLINKEFEMARQHLFKALEENPGSADSYYYLAELSYATGDYNSAWLAGNMAKRLGHAGRDIFRKLAGRQAEPTGNLWDLPHEGYYVRQMFVEKREEAEEILTRIRSGELFEDLAADLSMDPNGANGGYAGHFNPDEMHPEIAAVVMQSAPLAEPVIVPVEEGFQVVQRIIPFDRFALQGHPDGEPLRDQSGDAMQISPLKRKISTTGHTAKTDVPVIAPQKRKRAAALLPSTSINEAPATTVEPEGAPIPLPEALPQPSLEIPPAVSEETPESSQSALQPH